MGNGFPLNLYMDMRYAYYAELELPPTSMCIATDQPVCELVCIIRCNAKINLYQLEHSTLPLYAYGAYNKVPLLAIWFPNLK